MLKINHYYTNFMKGKYLKYMFSEEIGNFKSVLIHAFIFYVIFMLFIYVIIYKMIGVYLKFG